MHQDDIMRYAMFSSNRTLAGINNFAFFLPPPKKKKLWKTFRMIELLKSTLKTSLSLEVKYKEICGGSTPKTSSCFNSCLWNHKLVWVYVKVFGEKSHNTWEFISKTDLSLDKIDKKYILKKKYFTLFAVYVLSIYKVQNILNIPKGCWTKEHRNT